MQIKSDIYKKMLFSMPCVPPETGGIIGMENGIITHIYFDKCNPKKDQAIYIPNVQKLNDVISLWQDQNISFSGLFHSHPDGQKKLSKDDMYYIDCVVNAMPESYRELYFPIVIPNKTVVAYKVINDNHTLIIEEDIIKIIQ